MTEKDILEHPKHRRIEFLEAPHEYYFYPDLRKKEGVQFEGITSWIKSFEPYKDWDKIAKGSSFNPKSEWYGMDVEDIRAAWKQKGIDSAENGNAIHKAIENSIETGEYDEEYQFYIDGFWKMMDDNNIKPIAAEMVLYDEDIKRASPIDVVGLRDEQVIIIDIKTFADGMQYSSYKGETFNSPIDHLYTSKYIKTSLQTSIYKRWCEDYGWKTGEEYCALFSEETVELIPLMDLRDEIEKLYEWS